MTEQSKSNMIFLKDLYFHAVTAQKKTVKMEFRKGDIINPNQLPDKRDLSGHVDMTSKKPTVEINGYTVVREGEENPSDTKDAVSGKLKAQQQKLDKQEKELQAQKEELERESKRLLKEKEDLEKERESLDKEKKELEIQKKELEKEAKKLLQEKPDTKKSESKNQQKSK